MIKESKHPIARALFVDKSDLAEREKEDLEFVDKLISRESKLFASRYEILSVISSDNSHDNDENVNVENVNNNANNNIKSRFTKTHHHHLNVHKSHKFKYHHQRIHLHHPYHNYHHHHHPVVNNIDDSTHHHLVNDAPGTVTASYLAFILWQILLRSKRSW